MEFMTVKEAATKWGLSERRLQTICNEGMIPGVIKFGRSWAIPVNAQKPVDKRIKSGKYVKSCFGTFVMRKLCLGIEYWYKLLCTWIMSRRRQILYECRFF